MATDLDLWHWASAFMAGCYSPLLLEIFWVLTKCLQPSLPLMSPGEFVPLQKLWHVLLQFIIKIKITYGKYSNDYIITKNCSMV